VETAIFVEIYRYTPMKIHNIKLLKAGKQYVIIILLIIKKEFAFYQIK